MNNQEKNDPAWDLLQNASKTEASPFFARNVVREIRQLKDNQGLFSAILSFFRKPTVALGVAAVALVLFAAFLMADRPGTTGNNSGTTTAAVDPASSTNFDESSSSAFDPAGEFESIEYLGQLMVVADPGQLSDDALADLFF